MIALTSALSTGCVAETPGTDEPLDESAQEIARESPAYYTLWRAKDGGWLTTETGSNGQRSIRNVVLDDAGTRAAVLDNIDSSASAPRIIVFGTIVRVKATRQSPKVAYDLKAYDLFWAGAAQTLKGGHFYRVSHGNQALILNSKWGPERIASMYDSGAGEDGPKPWCSSEGRQDVLCITDLPTGLVVYGSIDAKGKLAAASIFPSYIYWHDDPTVVDNCNGSNPPCQRGRGRGLYPIDYLKMLSGNVLRWMYWSGQITLAELLACGVSP